MGLLWDLLGLLWGPLGLLWAPKGLLWGYCGSPWGCSGTTLGLLWGPLGLLIPGYRSCPGTILALMPGYRFCPGTILAPIPHLDLAPERSWYRFHAWILPRNDPGTDSTLGSCLRTILEPIPGHRPCPGTSLDAAILLLLHDLAAVA